MKDTTQTIAQIEKLVDELKAFNNINIQIDKPSLNIIFDKINQIKSVLTQSKSAETPVIWYDAFSLESYLVNTVNMDVQSAKAVAQPYADNLQQAYAKGWEQGYNRITGSNVETYVYYPKQLEQIQALNKNKDNLILKHYQLVEVDGKKMLKERNPYHCENLSSYTCFELPEASICDGCRNNDVFDRATKLRVLINPVPGKLEYYDNELTLKYQERNVSISLSWVDCEIDGIDPICRTGWQQRVVFEYVKSN